MESNYKKIIRDNLSAVFGDSPEKTAGAIPAGFNGKVITFNAFGGDCTVHPDRIILNGAEEDTGLGVVLSLYCRKIKAVEPVVEPLKSFKELPDSMPYTGAFNTHAQEILVPHVEKIETARSLIISQFSGREAPGSAGGDFSFLLQPLPRIYLVYIFYRADDEFPPSATCLFSNNAHEVLPVDLLADTGEYTSKKIIELVN